jgi:hypothetical protein
MTTQKWRKLTKWIRDHFIVLLPVKITRKKTDCCGKVFKDRGIWNITINIGQCDILQKDSLLHEWAHIMADECNGSEKRIHGPKWARWYGKIYEAWERDHG